MHPPRPGLLVPLVVLFFVTQAQAQPYERARFDGQGLCRRSRTFTYSLTTSATHPTQEERAAIKAAFDTWSAAAATCSDLVFKQVEDAPNQTPAPRDGMTLVTIRNVDCTNVLPPSDACFMNWTCSEKTDCWDHGSTDVVQATVTYQLGTGEIIGTRISLNATNRQLTTVASPPCPQGAAEPGCVAGDVQSLVTRSIGEALGLALLERRDSTMSKLLPWGDTQKRVIDPGTLQGLCELYPRGQPTPECNLPELPEDGDGKSSKSGGCDTTSSVPLLAALVLLLGVRRHRRSPLS